MNRRMFVAASLLSIVSACAAREEVVEDDDGQEHESAFSEDTSSSPAARELVEPQLSADERTQVLDRYAFLDPDHVVPKNLRDAAVVFYDFNKSKIPNRDYLTIVDFSKNSSAKRFFVINMRGGAVTQQLVAHGSGSDANNDGIAERFSNTPNSNASSLGFYLTDDVYTGKHGRSLRMDGISSTNSNVRGRNVVVHGASYVNESNTKQGRSWGCFALSERVKDQVIDQLRDGSVIYAGQSE